MSCSSRRARPPRSTTPRRRRATWGIDRIDQRALPLEQRPTRTPPAANVTAYVIDTGIRADHTEFGGRVDVAAGFNGDGRRQRRQRLPRPRHPRRRARSAAATYGVAKGVKLVPIRVLGCDGTGSDARRSSPPSTTSSRSTAPSAAVANMSLGFSAIVSERRHRRRQPGEATESPSRWPRATRNKNACNDTPGPRSLRDHRGRDHVSSDARAVLLATTAPAWTSSRRAASITSAWYTGSDSHEHHVAARRWPARTPRVRPRSTSPITPPPRPPRSRRHSPATPPAARS